MKRKDMVAASKFIMVALLYTVEVKSYITQKMENFLWRLAEFFSLTVHNPDEVMFPK